MIALGAFGNYIEICDLQKEFDIFVILFMKESQIRVFSGFSWEFDIKVIC
jgi:hypothetical protein